MIRLTSVIFLGFVLLMAQSSVAAKLCVEIFTSTKVPAETQISIDKAIESLAQMRISIDQEKSKGSSSVVLPTLAANFKKKEKELQEYLEKYGILTVLELNEKIKQQITRLQSLTKEIETKEEAQREDRRIVDSHNILEAFQHQEQVVFFNRVEPGQFLMGKPGFMFFDRRRKVTLTKPFEMMATPVTQGFWRKIAKIAEEEELLANLSALLVQKSHIKEDSFPMQQLEYHIVDVWIHFLNSLSKEGHPVLTEIIVGHKQGDVYRLPTEAEWEFVASNRGQFTNENHPFGRKFENIGDYAWTAENSNGETHVVASKKPLVIDGKKFYDIHGNVRELVSDYYRAKMDRKDATDPHVEQTLGNYRRTVRSGGYKTSAKKITTDLRYAQRVTGNRDEIGFRLVREVRP